MYSIIIEFLKPNLIFDSEKTERNQNKTTAIIPGFRFLDWRE